jgi:hypothetical protein
MTPRETVIEAMARVILLNGYPTPEGKTDDEHFTFIRLTNPMWWYIALEHSTDALNTLLAALPGLCLKVVPVEATEVMLDAGGKDANVFTDRGPGGTGGIYRAMIAATPDLLGTGKQALKDNTPNPLRNEMGV